MVCGVHCEPLGSSIAAYVAATESQLRRHLSAAHWEGDMLQIVINAAAMHLRNRLANNNWLLCGTCCLQWLDHVGLDTRRRWINGNGEAVNIQILRRGDQWLNLRDILT